MLQLANSILKYSGGNRFINISSSLQFRLRAENFDKEVEPQSKITEQHDVRERQHRVGDQQALSPHRDIVRTTQIEQDEIVSF